MLQNKTVLIGLAAAAVIGLVVVVVLVFRGSNNGGNNGTKTNKLVIWTPIDNQSTFDPLIQRFNDNRDKNSQIAVTVVKKDPATYEDEVVNAIASGKGPDIWMVRNDWMPKQIDKLTPLPDKATSTSDPVKNYKSTYISVVSQENIFNNKIYGVPLAADPLALFYNTTVVNKALNDYQNAHPNDNDPTLSSIMTYGPTTWDDITFLTKIMTVKQGSKIVTPAIAIGTTGNVDNSQDILYLLMLQNGTSFYNSNLSSATFGLPATSLTGSTTYPGTNALAYYTSFALPNSGNYSWNATMGNSLQAFANGQVGMTIDYSANENYIKQVSPTLNYKMVTVPQVKGSTTKANVARYWSMTVNHNAKDTTTAWDLVKFLGSEQIATLYQTATQSDSVFADNYSGGSSTNNLNVDAQLITAKQVYKPDATKFDQIMVSMIDDVTARNVGAQAAIDKAAASVTALIAETKQ